MQVKDDPYPFRGSRLLTTGAVTAKLTPAETLTEFKIEWAADRSVKLMIRDVTMTFST